MRVAIERQGGFAGLRRREEAEEADLSPEQRSALTTLRRVGSFLPPDPGADRFVYKVEIVEGGKTEVLRVPESHFPPALRRITPG